MYITHLSPIIPKSIPWFPCPRIWWRRLGSAPTMSSSNYLSCSDKSHLIAPTPTKALKHPCSETTHPLCEHPPYPTWAVNLHFTCILLPDPGCPMQGAGWEVCPHRREARGEHMLTPHGLGLDTTPWLTVAPLPESVLTLFLNPRFHCFRRDLRSRCLGPMMFSVPWLSPPFPLLGHDQDNLVSKLYWDIRMPFSG